MVEFKLNEYSEEKPKFLLRIVWTIINKTIFRLIIGKKTFFIRVWLLRLFGADLHDRVMIYPTCDIYAPWNLKADKYSCLGPNTEVYNKAKIVIGANSIISQGTYLCSASHDISQNLLPLVSKPIIVEDRAWVAADTFIGPGVKIGQGAVVGARAAVFKDVGPWTVVGGNPAKFIKNRELK